MELHVKYLERLLWNKCDCVLKFQAKTKIMKSFVLFLLLIGFSLNSYSQSNLQVENLSLVTDSYMLYRHVENKVKITFDGSKDELELEGINCEISELDNYFLVTPNSAQTAYIKISKGKKLIRTLKYDISNMPDPWMYLGDVKNGGRITGYEKSLNAKYAEGTPRKQEFVINKIVLFINEREIESSSGKLSEEMHKAIQMADSEATLSFNCYVEGEDKITRLMPTVFTKD